MAVDDYYLAGINIANISGADYIESAGLRGHNPGRPLFSQSERPDAGGIPCGYKMFRGQKHHAVSSDNLAERLRQR